MKWEMKLKQVEKLVCGSNAALFDRVVLLQEVYDDPGFRDFYKHVEDAIQRHLDGFLGDYGISFADASLMLRCFPEREKWAGGRVRELLAEALESRNVRTEPAPPRVPVTRKELDDVREALKRSELRSESLGREILVGKSELERLREENHALREENSRLRAQISELREIASRELVAG